MLRFLPFLFCLPALADPSLSVTVTQQSASSAIVELCMQNVPCCQAGYQAFLHVDPAQLQLVSADYADGIFWMPLVVPTQDIDGNIEVAAGIDFFRQEPPESGNACLCRLTFAILRPCSAITFPQHVPPSEFADLDGNVIHPALFGCVVGPCPAPEPE